MTIAKKITQYISTLDSNEPFVSSEFLLLGSRASIDQTLTRLVKRGAIIRVARGIYVKPSHNRFVGNVIPEPFKVAQTLAKTTGTVVQVHGSEAARQFGLSTQMATQAIFLTSGQNRKLHMGQLEITLKHVSTRKLACAGTKAGLAITALWYLGKEHVEPETIATIKNQLTPAEYETFKNAINTMPAWLSNTIHRYENNHA